MKALHDLLLSLASPPTLPCYDQGVLSHVDLPQTLPVSSHHHNLRTSLHRRLSLNQSKQQTPIHSSKPNSRINPVKPLLTPPGDSCSPPPVLLVHLLHSSMKPLLHCCESLKGRSIIFNFPLCPEHEAWTQHKNRQKYLSVWMNTGVNEWTLEWMSEWILEWMNG